MTQAWTPERIERLKELAAAGKTAAQIASDIGMTRNAVIGKMYRADINFNLADRPRAEPVAKPKTEPKQTRPLWGLGAANPAPRIKVVKDEPVFPVAPAPSGAAFRSPKPGEGISLKKLTHTTCRWPLSELMDKTTRFCGERVTTKTAYCRIRRETIEFYGVYCAHHHGLAYRKDVKRVYVPKDKNVVLAAPPKDGGNIEELHL